MALLESETSKNLYINLNLTIERQKEIVPQNSTLESELTSVRVISGFDRMETGA